MSRGLFLLIVPLLFLVSCTTIEQAATHGFNSGYYRMHSAGKVEKVYASVEDNRITAYTVSAKNLSDRSILNCSLLPSDSACHYPFHFSKTSIDIDLTSVLFKYRPTRSWTTPVSGHLPGQLVTDFNAAIYAGPRFDKYNIIAQQDPLGKCRYRVVNRGFDVGILAGLGTTPINPFTTRNQLTTEYSALLIQTGLAAFIETSFASFGISGGFDFITGSQRRYWVYQGKPWIGLVIGIALN